MSRLSVRLHVTITLCASYTNCKYFYKNTVLIWRIHRFTFLCFIINRESSRLYDRIVKGLYCTVGNSVNNLHLETVYNQVSVFIIEESGDIWKMGTIRLMQHAWSDLHWTDLKFLTRTVKKNAFNMTLDVQLVMAATRSKVKNTVYVKACVKLLLLKLWLHVCFGTVISCYYLLIFSVHSNLWYSYQQGMCIFLSSRHVHILTTFENEPLEFGFVPNGFW